MEGAQLESQKIAVLGRRSAGSCVGWRLDDSSCVPEHKYSRDREKHVDTHIKTLQRPTALTKHNTCFDQACTHGAFVALSTLHAGYKCRRCLLAPAAGDRIRDERGHGLSPPAAASRGRLGSRPQQQRGPHGQCPG